MSNQKIRVIIYKDGASWIAQGIEHDICVQASNLDDLKGRFLIAVRLESSEEGGLDRIPSAPKYFHDMWNRRSGSFTPAEDGDDKYEYGIAA